MNRRHFLKGTGTALLGVATAGLALKETIASPSVSVTPQKGWWVSEGFGPDAPFYWEDEGTVWDRSLRDMMKQAAYTRSRLLYDAFKTL